MPTAYSYLRFSSPEQAKGDSIRRQTAARDAWLAAHPGVTLDTSLKMTDAGRSGYKRDNWDTYALAEFVELVKKGRVPKGSYLLVENLDRLSREEAGEAVELLLSIVNRGVTVVQLMPAVIEFAKPVNAMQLMFAIVELSRGHSESKTKSERIGAAWSNKLKRSDKHLVTRRTPGWIKVEDGKPELDEAKAATVRRMFDLCVSGHSARGIAKLFNDEGVPLLGRAKMKGRPCQWNATTVRHILTSRACVGEFTPYKADGKKAAGEPVPNYFPAVVGEDTFQKARAALQRRAAVGRGRQGGHVNLFAGLLTDVRSGGPLTYCHGGGTCRIGPSAYIHGAPTKWTSFPAAVFEAAILKQLKEVEVEELEVGDAKAKVEAQEKLVKKLKASIKNWLSKSDDPDLFDMAAAKLGELKRELAVEEGKLEALEREAASPAGEALEEVQTLADLLATDNSDENRLRVRGALRQCIGRMLCSFVSKGQGKGRLQCALVRIEFTQGTMREYVILHRSGSDDPPFVGSKAGPINMTAPVNWKEVRRQYLAAMDEKMRRLLEELAAPDNKPS